MATKDETKVEKKADESGKPASSGSPKVPDKQRAVVEELSRDPAAQHPAEVASAPLTEHGETSGLKPLVDDLHERRATIKLGGGEERIERQHAKGKLTARERVDLL